MDEEKKYTKQDLIDLADWFNENQWRDGKHKALFCKCEYQKIVEYYLIQKEKKEKFNNASVSELAYEPA